MKRFLRLAATLSLFLLVSLPAGAQVQTERLAKLADHLEGRVNPKNFNIMNWGNMTRTEDPSYVGCAAGHATSLFTADGFRYGRPFGYPMIVYQRYSGLEACEQYFGLDPTTARFLFTNMGEANKDPKVAARNIRSIRMLHAGVPDYGSALGRSPQLMVKRE